MKMKKKISLIFILAIVLAVFFACLKTDASANAADDSFILRDWLELTDIPVQLLFAGVYVFANPFDDQPIFLLEANEDQKNQIVELLMDLVFTPADPEEYTKPDFFLSMDEHVVRFCFVNEGLIVHWARWSRNDWEYRFDIALFEDYPELWDLSKFTGIMRLTYFEEQEG
jgi:hypothetical protein